MAKNNKVEISLEEKLKQALVPVDEQPYTIPSNWVWTRLGNICEKISKGTTPRGEDGYTEEGINFLRVENIGNNNSIDLSRVKYISENTHNGFLKRSILKEKDILISIAGTLGKTAIVKNEDLPANINQAISFVRLIDNNNLLEKFIAFYLNTPTVKEDLLGQVKVTAIPNLTLEIISDIKFPLPPLNEQKRIVEKLDFLFEKTKRAKEIIEEVKIDIENRKISILDRAFKGTLTSKWRNENKTSDVKELLKTINEEKIKKWEEDCLQAEKDGNKKPKKPIIKEVKDMIVPVDEQPYKLPDSWVWVRLGDIGKITSGGTPTSNEKSYYGGDIIWITPADMSKQQSSPWFSNSSKKITNLGLQKSSAQLIEGNSVVYSSRAPIGYVNIVKDKFTTSQGCKSVTPIKNSLMYIYYVLIERTEDIKYRASGTTFKEISALEFGKTLVPLPPLEEQQEIVRVLDEVLENENKVKELLELEERIDVLEKSILHKAFKGELGTQNSSDESALNLLKSIL